MSSDASLLRTSLDYTSKDFDALRARLFNLVESAFPAWTDRQVADFGNILIELYAFVGDTLSFYQDNQAKESRWSAAQLRRSLLGMVKLINFIPSGANAAQADLTFQLQAPPVGPVTIAIGDTFRTLEAANAVTFQAITNAIIPAGADPPVAKITVEHSAPSEETLLSTGLPDQEYVLGDAPYLDGSLAVSADDGAFTAVRDFLSSAAEDRHYTIAVDENDKAHVRFGNGIAGSIPTGTIQFQYKTGGGQAGNVEPGAIRRAVKAYTDSFGNAVNVSVTNPARAGGGLERQTVEGIRYAAPRSLRAMTRSVIREDFEINALRVPGVVRALMVSREQKLSVPENAGELYVVPAGGGAASTVMLADVDAMIRVKYPKTITFRVTVLPASYLVVNVTARVHLVRGALAAVVGPAIRKNLAEFFAPIAADGSINRAVDFGYYLDGALAFSDIFNVVRDTVGVRKIDDGLGALTLNGAAQDLDVPVEKFPVLGTVGLIDAVTGIAMP